MQNFARNSALAKILGLAKMHNFAKIAKFLLCHSEMHRGPAATVPLATVLASCILHPTASLFFYFLLLFPLSL